MSKYPEKIESQNKSYKILDLLGEGGTSAVYLANDGKREVALKILGEEVDPAFKEKYVQILKNEFDVLSKLRHPNIAEVYDFEYSRGLNKYFFTTEYIKGTDIYNFTENTDARIKEELFVQLLTSLDYVHRCGVIHCDIKCGNALVTHAGKMPVVKLVDFGFATRRLATGGNVVGTAHYLAPELLVQERKDVDHRIDIYAAGVVYYRLLHRTYPYDSSSVNAILRWHREHSSVPFAEELPDYVKQLILRMIETYPTDRIATCAKAVEFINLRTEGRYKDAVEKIVGSQFKEGPLVGRQVLLKKAEGMIEEIKSGKSPAGGGFICIGQQGIGKSRLLKEVKYRAELNEIPIKEFVCVDGQNHVDEFVGEPREAADKSEEARKLADIRWINAFLEKYGKSGLLILIDDVQLADSAFINFLSIFEGRLNVSRADGTLPISFLIGSRPRSELSGVVGRWFDKTGIEKAELGTLDKAAVEDYLAKIGITDVKKQAEAAIAFSGGVPGLVEAYSQHILLPGGDARPPASLAQSYLDRTKKLSKGAMAELEFISVAKRNLTSENLAELASLDRSSVSDGLRELIEIGFVTIGYPAMDVMITNKAIAEVIRSNLSGERVRAVSKSLGIWLEKTDSAALPEIAEYYSEAGAADRARCYAELAAKSFEDKFNNSEAARFYEMALRYVADEEKRRSLVRGVARMNILMGNYKNSIEKIQGLVSKGDPSLENYRILGMACVKMHDFERAKDWYEEGLRKMKDKTPIDDIVHFKNSLGNVYFYSGNLALSEKYFTEAIADATEELLFNNNLGLILSAKGNYEQAIRFYDDRKRYLAAKNNRRVLSLCFAECGYIHMVHNHPAEAISELEESFKLASESGDLYNILVIIGNLVRCCQQTAQYSKALDYALKGLEVEGGIGSVEEIAQNHLTIGILYETIGVFDLARQRINIARDRFVALGNSQMEGWCRLAMSYVYKDVDKYADAVKELDAADGIVSRLKLADLEVWANYARADLYCEYGKTKEAATVFDRLGDVSSPEFAIRKKLLGLKLMPAGQKEAQDLFEELAEQCDAFPELKWEVYAALGNYLEGEEKTDWALNSYRQAFSAIESVAGKLSEAYRDSYMLQRFRLKVVQRFKPELASKITSPGQQRKEALEAKTSEIK